MWLFPLQLSQPARMQGRVVTCHCGHPGCIIAAWTLCPVPGSMSLRQLMVQIHPGISYLHLVMEIAPSVEPSNPLVPGGGEEKGRPDIPIQVFQVPIRSKWLQWPQRTRTQPFSLGSHFYFGTSQLYHCSLCIFLLYITALVGRHQFLFNRLLPFFNAPVFFLDHSFILPGFVFFPIKSCMQKHKPTIAFKIFLYFPYKVWNFPELGFLNNPEFSTFPFQQGHVFGSNTMLRVFFILLWRD